MFDDFVFLGFSESNDVKTLLVMGSSCVLYIFE